MSIHVEHLTHIYSASLPDETIALEDISFDIDDGQFVGIIGHTGSGKSTLVQHLNGLIKPTEGRIVVDDCDITDSCVKMNEIRKKIGLVFQYPEYQLFEETVAKDVAFGPKNLGLSDDEIELRVSEALELVGLDPDVYGGKSPFELSGGQKRKVAIAGVLAMEPGTLILDEPTAGLDPQAHRDILAMIRKLHDRGNVITILISHNMADIAELADKVLVIDRGRLAMEGTPRRVFSRGEELRNIGLGRPPAADFAQKLADAGFDIKSDILSVEEVTEEISRILQRGQK